MSSCYQPPSASTEAPGRLGNIPEDCQEKIRQIVDYWISIHPESGLPGRQHFDPLDIPQLLPNLRLQDIVGDPPRIRMRLMGTRILEFFGQEHTGKWFDATFVDFKSSRTYQDFLSVVQTNGRTGGAVRRNWFTERTS